MGVTSTHGSLDHAVALLEAVERDELSVQYQPIVEIDTQQVRVAEALLRWRHSELGVLLPAEFLPEELKTGLGRVLTDFVAERAVAACRGWLDQLPEVGVAINVPPAALVDDHVVNVLAGGLDHHGLAPTMLTVEVTEQALGVHSAQIERTLHALRELGVHISLDDFGLGDSSLSRLRRLPFDQLKIDRTFVAAAPHRRTDRTIVRFATEMAHDLGMTIVAEGVETAAEHETVRSLGVDYGQGFRYGRPGADPAFTAPIVLP